MISQMSGQFSGQLDNAINASRNFLLNHFTPCDTQDRPLPAEASSELGYWLGELEGDTTLESDYILFLYFLRARAFMQCLTRFQ